MRLAANVAHTVDVGGMLDQMTLREFAEWEAFDRIDPIGNEGVCHVLALIGSLIAGLTGNKIGPSKFLP